MSGLTKTTVAEAVRNLPLHSKYLPYRRDVMQSFVRSLGTIVSSIPELRPYVERYLASPVWVCDKTRLPKFSVAVPDGKHTVWGSEWMLVVPDVLPFSIDESMSQLLAIAEPESHGMFDVPLSLQRPQSSEVSTHVPLHAMDLREPLSSLPSKQRNEVRRANTLYPCVDTRLDNQATGWRLSQLFHRWANEPGEPEEEENNAAYQVMLFLFAEAAALYECGEFVNLYSAGVWVATAGFIHVGDYYHFNCFFKNPEVELPYIGLKALIESHRLLPKTPVRNKVLLTCPDLAVLDHGYEVYKKHLSMFRVPSYGYFAFDTEKFDEEGRVAPYYLIREGRWVV